MSRFGTKMNQKKAADFSARKLQADPIVTVTVVKNKTSLKTKLSWRESHLCC